MMDCAGYLYKIKYSEFMEYLTNWIIFFH
jgi:hypothetical protein